jgi:methylase of polypeptide subunit release factors
LEPARGLRREAASALLRLLRFLVSRVHGVFEAGGCRLRVPRGCLAPVFVSTGLAIEVSTRLVRGRVGCDVGTGCGAIALSLAKKLSAEVIGTDVDYKCLAASVVNARSCGVYELYHPVLCVGASCLRSGSVEFAVTNPPYLPLPPKKPVDTALCGGGELEVYSSMVEDSLRVLKPGGILVFTASSLTGSVLGAVPAGRRLTPFDAVLAYVLVKRC